MEQVKTKKAVAIKKQVNTWGVKETSLFKKIYNVKSKIDTLSVEYDELKKELVTFMQEQEKQDRKEIIIDGILAKLQYKAKTKYDAKALELKVFKDYLKTKVDNAKVNKAIEKELLNKKTVDKYRTISYNKPTLILEKIK